MGFFTALHISVQSNTANPKVTKLLLENGCDANSMTFNGYFVLHIATMNEVSIEVVEIMVQILGYVVYLSLH
jgi:hypothetical protein